MTGEAWAQLGFGGAFFSLAIFILQAGVRGTWQPSKTVLQLLAAKDELLALKDEQIRLLTADRDAWKTTAETSITLNSKLTDGFDVVKHFFETTPAVPSKGDTDEART
jgi:hypothetical protein